MRSLPLWLTTTFALLLPTAELSAQARIDFVHPVAGGAMEIVVDRVPPDAEVVLALGGPAGAVPLETQRADASGTARFGYSLPPAVAGETVEFLATFGAGEGAVARVTIDRPQLLVTGEESGGAWLSRVAVEEDGRTFTLLDARELGAGLPGGAVRDGQRTKTYVVADRVAGRLAVVPDDPTGIVTGHPLAPDVRDIALTPDGRFVLVTSAGGAGDVGILAVFDARTEKPVANLLLDPLGAHGGKLVVTEDGLRAFVSVSGLYLLEIDLLRRERGDLVGVGGPGQDEIKDLRLVDGHLFALTGRSDEVGYVTALDVADLRNARLAGPTRTESRFGVAAVDGAAALVLLDGGRGAVTVLDARTMALENAFEVPAGADALLFSPNAARSSGELLYPRGESTTGLRVDFATATLGVERRYDGRLAFLPVHGRATRIDLFFARAADGSVVAIDPETLAPLDAPPLAPGSVRALSVAD